MCDKVQDGKSHNTDASEAMQQYKRNVYQEQLRSIRENPATKLEPVNLFQSLQVLKSISQEFRKEAASIDALSALLTSANGMNYSMTDLMAISDCFINKYKKYR